MNDIKLNFINNSNDTNNSSVVIFQKNDADPLEQAVAWKVILNCGRGDNHPFLFSTIQQISASDSYGNYTPQLDANPGDSFAMVFSESGDVLQKAGYATSPLEIQLINHLNQGAINGSIYRDGKLLATKTNMAPGQRAVFQFAPRIFIGATSQISEGQMMNSAIISDLNTEISLIGIASADIIMTGGGSGPTATPFNFTLSNVQMA